eukprot:757400-Hanusia_phi.AAC.1
MLTYHPNPGPLRLPSCRPAEVGPRRSLHLAAGTQHSGTPGPSPALINVGPPAAGQTHWPVARRTVDTARAQSPYGRPGHPTVPGRRYDVRYYGGTPRRAARPDRTDSSNGHLARLARAAGPGGPGT